MSQAKAARPGTPRDAGGIVQAERTRRASVAGWLHLLRPIRVRNSGQAVFESAVKCVADHVSLGLLWLASCLLVVTAPGGTSAFIRVLFLWSTGSEHDGYVRCFLMNVRRSFKRSLSAWLVIGLVGAIVGIDSIFVLSLHGMFRWAGCTLWLSMAIVYCIWSTAATSMIAITDSSTAEVLKRALIMSVRHLPSSLGTVALVLAYLLLGVVAPIGLLLLPAAFGRIAVRLSRVYFEIEA